MRGIPALIVRRHCLLVLLGLLLRVQMHPDRENIFAVGPEERRTMVRKLLVELERLRPRYDDSSKPAIDKQALLLGAVVSSGYMMKQESPAVSGISPKPNNLGLVVFPWKGRL